MTGPAQLLEVVAPDRRGRKHAKRRIDHALDSTQLQPIGELVRRVLADAAAAAAASSVAATTAAVACHPTRRPRPARSAPSVDQTEAQPASSAASITSGVSVHSPSTPQRASSTKRAGSLHVQPLTRIPTSWQRSIDVGRDRRLPRVHRGVAPPGQLARRVPVDGRRQPRRRHLGGDEVAAVDRLQPERRQQPPARPALGQVGEHLDGERGRRGRSRARAATFLISMLTHAPAQLSSASPSVGTWSGRSRQRVSTITRPSGSTASWWTTTTPSAGQTGVELDALGPEGRRPARTPRSCSPAPAATRPGGR